MATYTLTGDLGGLVGSPLTSPNGALPRVYLIPSGPIVVGAEVRVGSIELTLDVNGVFTQTGVPEGAHRVMVHYYNPSSGQMVDWTSGLFLFSGNSDLAVLLSLPPFDPGADDGSLIVPVASANSGTAYNIAAPLHNERRLKLTLTGSPTVTMSGGTAAEVCSVQLHLIQDATGSRTVTWPGNLDWGVAGAPVLSIVAAKIDVVYLTTDDGGLAWQGALVGSGY